MNSRELFALHAVIHDTAATARGVRCGAHNRPLLTDTCTHTSIRPCPRVRAASIPYDPRPPPPPMCFEHTHLSCPWADEPIGLDPTHGPPAPKMCPDQSCCQFVSRERATQGLVSPGGLRGRRFGAGGAPGDALPVGPSPRSVHWRPPPPPACVPVRERRWCHCSLVGASVGALTCAPAPPSRFKRASPPHSSSISAPPRSISAMASSMASISAMAVSHAVSVPSVDECDDDEGSERFALDEHTEKDSLRFASTPAGTPRGGTRR